MTRKCLRVESSVGPRVPIRTHIPSTPAARDALGVADTVRNRQLVFVNLSAVLRTVEVRCSLFPLRVVA